MIKYPVVFAALFTFNVAIYGQATSTVTPPAKLTSAEAKAKSDADQEKRAEEWISSLSLGDAAKEARVKAVVANHLKTIRDWNNEHPFSTVPAGINPATGNKLTELDRQVIAISA